MVCGPVGYVGAVLVEQGRTNIAAAIRKDAGKPWECARGMLAQAGYNTNSFDAQQWNACPVLQRTTAHRTAERLALVGDAAGYLEPITGEGLAWAASSGELAAHEFASGWSASAATRYEVAWNRAVGRRRKLVLGAALALDRPLATRAMAGLLTAWPSLGRNIAERLVTPSNPAVLREVAP